MWTDVSILASVRDSAESDRNNRMKERDRLGFVAFNTHRLLQEPQILLHFCQATAISKHPLERRVIIGSPHTPSVFRLLSLTLEGWLGVTATTCLPPHNPANGTEPSYPGLSYLLLELRL